MLHTSPLYVFIVVKAQKPCLLNFSHIQSIEKMFAQFWTNRKFLEMLNFFFEK